MRRETLAGPIAAYEDFASVYGSGGSAEWLVVVRDLRNGRVLHEAPTGGPWLPVEQNLGVGPTVAIVVKRDGAVAWIAGNDSLSPREYQVHTVDKTGSRLLAAGTDIDPHSLALKGSTLYWTQGGKPVSATLY